jgi:hypothetical protein
MARAQVRAPEKEVRRPIWRRVDREESQLLSERAAEPAGGAGRAHASEVNAGYPKPGQACPGSAWVRSQSTVPFQFTQAPYERHQHEQLARLAGLTRSEIDATTLEHPAAQLGPDHALICQATDEITASVRLADDTLALVRRRWGDPGARELILVVAYYNMVSRFLESARVPLEGHDLLGEGFGRPG